MLMIPIGRTFSISLIFFHVLWSWHWLLFVRNYHFKREEPWNTDTVSKRTCSWIGLEDMCFPPEQRQPSLLSVIRDLGSISSDFHSCNATHWVYRHHWGSLESPWKNQSYGKQYKPWCYADYCYWYECTVFFIQEFCMFHGLVSMIYETVSI